MKLRPSLLRLCERKPTQESFCKDNSFPFESQKLSRGSSEPRKPLLIASGVGLSWNGGEQSEKKRTKRLRPWLSLFRRRRKKTLTPLQAPKLPSPRGASESSLQSGRRILTTLLLVAVAGPR